MVSLKTLGTCSALARRQGGESYSYIISLPKPRVITKDVIMVPTATKSGAQQ